MTANQISYWDLQERMRSNRANENEKYRSNRAQERETNRANVAREVETTRSNVTKETETNRHNLETEKEAFRTNSRSIALEESKLRHKIKDDNVKNWISGFSALGGIAKSAAGLMKLFGG